MIIIFLGYLLIARVALSSERKDAMDNTIINWEDGSYHQGDIDMTVDEINNIIALDNIIVDFKYLKPSFVWPENRVPFYISGSFRPAEISAIQSAIREFHEKTCVRFIRVERTSDDHFVYFRRLHLCHSKVGRQVDDSIGYQTVSLDYGCLVKGTIIHLIMHVLGFFHEQSRQDRDNFVHVIKENIMPRKVKHFEKFNWKRATRLGPYDVGSIMHFDADAFTTDGKSTIEQKNGGSLIGNRNNLSKLDVYKIEKLYNCASSVISVSTISITECLTFTDTMKSCPVMPIHSALLLGGLARPRRLELLGLGPWGSRSRNALPGPVHNSFCGRVSAGTALACGAFGNPNDCHFFAATEFRLGRPGPGYPGPMVDVASAVLGEGLYALGGFEFGRGTGGAYVFADGEWAPIAPLREGRYNHAAAAGSARVFAIGGQSSDNAPLLDSVEAYDPGVDAWTPLSALPSGRIGHAAAVLGGRLYVGGGWDSVAYLDEVESLDLGHSGARWEPAAPMTSARWRHGLLSQGGRLVAFGGFNGDHQLDSVEVFEPAAEQWLLTKNRISRPGSYFGYCSV